MESFSQKVLEIVAQIPMGKVTTYGAIAKALGKPRGARMVVWALWSGPPWDQIPYHRVVNSRGELAPAHIFGEGVQRERLEGEGVSFKADGAVDLKKSLWVPKI